MEKGNTKQEILNAALDLFSTQGFEATSISQLSDAVGIRKASLYSHFSSKQEILDLLLRHVLEHYDRHSVFARAEAGAPSGGEGTADPTDTAVRLVLEHVRFILRDSEISRGRKLLTIEQFRNAQMAGLQTKYNYADVMRYFTNRIRDLIRRGALADADPEMMAAQLCLPISAWINLCDREPEREEEILKLIERHVRRFFACYQPQGRTETEACPEYKVRNIYGENYGGRALHCREASRAVIVAEGKILLSHEVNIGRWMLPGGGMEPGEAPEACCVREAAEETGLLVRPERCFLVLNEYYQDWRYISRYFVCRVVGATERRPTEAEKTVGATPEWVEIERAADIFARYPDYAETDEERRGIYLRESLALADYLQSIASARRGGQGGEKQ